MIELRLPAGERELAARGRALLEIVGAVEERPVEQAGDARAVDPTALAAVVLAVPPSLLALAELVERLGALGARRKLHKAATALIEAADQARPTLSVNGRSLDLANATPDQVVDLLTSAADERQN